jgi:hypothetical protein
LPSEAVSGIEADTSSLVSRERMLTPVSNITIFVWRENHSLRKRN